MKHSFEINPGTMHQIAPKQNYYENSVLVSLTDVYIAYFDGLVKFGIFPHIWVESFKFSLFIVLACSFVILIHDFRRTLSWFGHQPSTITSLTLHPVRGSQPGRGS